MLGKRWSSAEDAILLNNPKLSMADLARMVSALGSRRKPHAVACRRGILGLTGAPLRPAKPKVESIWTEERTEKLKKLWADGLSCSDISRELGTGISRAAVIGKLNRIGLKRLDQKTERSFAGKKGSQSVRRWQRPTYGHLASLAPAPSVGASEPVLSPNAKPWIERSNGECAFPIGGSGADTKSCCNETAGTYCAGHKRDMYQPAKPINTSGIDLTKPTKSPRRSKASERFFSEWAA